LRPDNPLLPNYKWLPIGYHGRASSIRVSGYDFARPMGQVLPPGAARPELAATRRLDYELEVGRIRRAWNELGRSVPLAHAEAHVFGLCLLNDWSARDIQAWEYQPLGPFLAKNFATTVSPWVWTLEALAPFRGFLESTGRRAAGRLHTSTMSALRRSGRHRYSTGGVARQRGACALQICGRSACRMRASATRGGPSRRCSRHHTVNGCNLNAGDLFRQRHTVRSAAD